MVARAIVVVVVVVSVAVLVLRSVTTHWGAVQ